MYFSRRKNYEIFIESRVFSIQYSTSVMIMSQKLLEGVREVEELNNQIFNMNQMLVEKDKENEI